MAREGADTLVAFAAAPGETAADGEGEHSPFATALIANLGRPGVDIRLALGGVRDDVVAATNGRQAPFITGSLGRDAIVLARTEAGAVPATAPAIPRPAIADLVRACDLLAASPHDKSRPAGHPRGRGRANGCGASHPGLQSRSRGGTFGCARSV